MSSLRGSLEDKIAVQTVPLLVPLRLGVLDQNRVVTPSVNQTVGKIFSVEVLNPQDVNHPPPKCVVKK
jgi:hypothetical protein